MFCHDKLCLKILTNLTGIRNEWQRFDREETAVYNQHNQSNISL